MHNFQMFARVFLYHNVCVCVCVCVCVVRVGVLLLSCFSVSWCSLVHDRSVVPGVDLWGATRNVNGVFVVFVSVRSFRVGSRRVSRFGVCAFVCVLQRQRGIGSIMG